MFLFGVFQPTISALSGLSDNTSDAFSLINIPDANENSSGKNSEDDSVLDDFFHAELFLNHFLFSNAIFYLSYETILVSGFTEIIIPPPKS